MNKSFNSKDAYLLAYFIYIQSYSLIVYIFNFGSNSPIWYMYVLLSSLSLYHFLRRNFFLSLAIFIVAVKPYILIDFYPPLSSIDASNYYYYAFKSNETRSISDVIYGFLFNGELSIIEMTAILYKSISFIFGSNSEIILVYANYMMVFWSACIVGSTFKLDKNKLGFYVLLVVLSPLLNKYSTLLLKEAMVCLLTSMIFYCYIRKFAIIYVLFLILIITIVRPYGIFWAISYIIIFGKIKPKTSFNIILFSYSTLCIFFVYFWNGNIFLYTKDMIMSFLALFLSPNFLRFGNWDINFFLALESLLLTLFFIIYLYASNWRNKKILVLAMLTISLILGAVSYNRSLSDHVFFNSGSLLSDDISRKKVPFQLLLYILPFLVSNRRYQNV